MSSKKRKIDEISTSCYQEELDKEFIKKFTEKRLVSKESWNDRLYNMLSDIQDKSNTYLNFDNIINDFRESLLRNREGLVNRCLECGIDMGRCNPRQLCCKTYCSNKMFT